MSEDNKKKEKNNGSHTLIFNKEVYKKPKKYDNNLNGN